MATYIEIQQQIQALQKEGEALKAAERKGVIERMKEAIAVYDVTAADLGFTRGPGRPPKSSQKGSGKRASKATGGPAKAAYREGNGNTWAGRGARPRWLKEALAGGAKLEDFAS